MPVAPLQGALAARVLEAASAATLQARETERVTVLGRFGIRFFGDPILAEPAVELMLPAEIPEYTRTYVRALAMALRRVCAERRGGVAIAAQQVGAQSAVLLTPVKNQRTIMVNPRITRKSRKKALDTEGCLSIPDFWISKERHTWVEVEFTPEDLSAPIRVKLEGFEARAAQHELDHLAGICIADGVSRQQRRRAERCAAKWRTAS